MQSSLSFVNSDGKPVTNETSNRSLRGVILVSGTGLELIGLLYMLMGLMCCRVCKDRAMAKLEQGAVHLGQKSLL